MDKKLTEKASSLIEKTIGISQSKQDLMEEIRKMINDVARRMKETGFIGKVLVEVDCEQAYADIARTIGVIGYRIKSIHYEASENSSRFYCSTNNKVVPVIDLSPLHMSVFLDHFLELIEKVKEEEEKEFVLLNNAVNKLWGSM